MDRFKKLFQQNNIVGLFDHDGSICDTNGVKDELLGSFCRKYWGGQINDCNYNEIHRGLHGRPMAEIFVAIAKELHFQNISLEKGQVLSDELNEFIKPLYLAKPMYEGANEFYTLLNNMGVDQYILTGMEVPIVTQSLEIKKICNLFKGVLGAPETKEQNIKNVIKEGQIILAIGDAMSEYKETMKYTNTIFVAVDFENRPKSLFPEGVRIITSYKDIIPEIIRQAEELSLI